MTEQTQDHIERAHGAFTLARFAFLDGLREAQAKLCMAASATDDMQTLEHLAQLDEAMRSLSRHAAQVNEKYHATYEAMGI